MGKSPSEGRLEGVTNSSDGTALGDMQQRSRDGREEMGMFVGVNVSDVDSGALELLNLGECFALDIVFADGSTEKGLDEVEEGWPEGLAVGAEQGGDALRVRDRDAVGEDDMATDAELGVGVCDGYGVVECGPGCHESG